MTRTTNTATATTTRMMTMDDGSQVCKSAVRAVRMAAPKGDEAWTEALLEAVQRTDVELDDEVNAAVRRRCAVLSERMMLWSYACDDMRCSLTHRAMRVTRTAQY
eukprot:1245199-Rhodomonas_salina.1